MFNEIELSKNVSVSAMETTEKLEIWTLQKQVSTEDCLFDEVMKQHSMKVSPIGDQDSWNQRSPKSVQITRIRSSPTALANVQKYAKSDESSHESVKLVRPLSYVVQQENKSCSQSSQKNQRHLDAQRTSSKETNDTTKVTNVLLRKGKNKTLETIVGNCNEDNNDDDDRNSKSVSLIRQRFFNNLDEHECTSEMAIIESNGSNPEEDNVNSLSRSILFKREKKQKKIFVPKLSRQQHFKLDNKMTNMIKGASLINVTMLHKYDTKSDVRDKNATPSRKIAQSRFNTNIVGDDDVWVEMVCGNIYSDVISSIFVSKKTGKMFWDEPPSGASKVIFLKDIERQRAINAISSKNEAL